MCPCEASRSRSRSVGWRLRGTGRACTWWGAQSDHRCGRHGESYSDISGTGTVLG
ncbi:hypothetical protein DPMN_071072 [Dreissena polymorpha]|uniref:Uncharacterized protein n=1 Tax=Dreissena polymorpha TaxID=45954 RepID=A0A9D3Z286_DREPO|nr:hypothetical protein DPMN_071072 [Dreissena polymorpha]